MKICLERAGKSLEVILWGYPAGFILLPLEEEYCGVIQACSECL
jgi:hypothetical protein